MYSFKGEIRDSQSPTKRHHAYKAQQEIGLSAEESNELKKIV